MPAWRLAAALLGIAACVTSQFAWVKPTNFGGFDEWFVISRVGRGIVDHPLANRPLALLWSLPAAAGPPSLWTYHVLHTLYLAGVGALVYLICLRLRGVDHGIAFLAGVFAATWAPLDYVRLNVTMVAAGQTFGAYLAVALLVEAWHRRQRSLLMLALLFAFVSLRGYEAGAGLLVAAPLLLTATRRQPRAWRWILAWEAVVLFGIALAALPLVLPSRAVVYQKQLLGGIDLHPIRVGARLLDLYQQHLLPLVTTPPAQLLEPAVAVTVSVFLLAFVFAAGGPLPPDDPGEAGGDLRAMALGLVLAGAGYAMFALSVGMTQTGRTQFFSAPGIGLFLAASFGALAWRAPRSWSRPLLALLGAWVVAVGAARTVGLQSFWDTISVHADQVRLLSSFGTIAPRLRPNSLVVLIDEAAVFEATFAFRAALDHLYRRDAIGFVWGKPDLGFPARLLADGIAVEPWPQLRADEPVTFHRFDEVLILHQPRTGPLRLLLEWPSLLPPLPPGARYAPAARVLRESPPRERRILLSPPAQPSQ